MKVKYRTGIDFEFSFKKFVMIGIYKMRQAKL